MRSLGISLEPTDDRAALGTPCLWAWTDLFHFFVFLVQLLHNFPLKSHPKGIADRFACLQGQGRCAACRADSAASNNRRRQAARSRIAYQMERWVWMPDTKAQERGPCKVLIR
jgi:hypothetical protein